MKKFVICISASLLAVFFGIIMYYGMTNEKTNYEYTEFNQIPNLVKNNDKIIIFVKQDGCAPCKLVDPTVNDYAKNNKGVVYSIVANEDKDYASQSKKYQIQGTPTLIYFKQGKEVQRMNTGFSDTEFQEMIKEVDF